MSQVTLQGNASGTGIFTIAAPNSDTNRTVNLPDAGGDVVLADATQTLTNKSISGAQINSGTVAVARLGSGTPGSGNFLRGDGSWQTISTTPTTDQVLTATAGASAGAVGTYSLLQGTTLIGQLTTRTATGATIAGSSLRYSSTQIPSGGGTPSGTWRCMGIERNNNSENTSQVITLWLRIS
jgi:hypothetical protein